MRLATEDKALNYVHSDHLKSLRKLAEEYKVKHKIVVPMEPRKRKTEDGILILPYNHFMKDIESLLLAGR